MRESSFLTYRHFSLYFLFLFWNQPFSALAQETNFVSATGIRIAYMGSVFHPGFNIGVERPYKVTHEDFIRPYQTKTIYKERYFSYSFGMYHHKTYHTNFLLRAEWVARRQYSKGLFLQGNFGTGFCRTFLDGATFQVNDNGEVSKVPMAGNFYGILSIGTSIGYNFKLKRNRPFSIYLKPDLILMLPYNRFVVPRLTVELGAIYNLKGFWEANPKRTYKEKKQKSNRKEM